MAIIIREEKKKSAVVPIIAGLLILAGASALTYYLFFSPVPFVDLVGKSARYESVSKFSKVNLDIDSVTNSPVWAALVRESPVPPLNLEVIQKKTNPFRSF